MRKLALIGLTIALSATCSASDVGWTPDAKAIAKLESLIDLRSAKRFGGQPTEALTKYARFYAGVMVKGHRMIRGVLVLDALASFANLDAPLGPHIVSEMKLPDVMDGGCGIVNLLYDPKAAHMVAIWCNGVA